MAPIFEDGNNKKDPPREEDLFETSTKVNQRNSPIPSPSMFRYQVYSVLKLTGLPLFTFAQSFGVQPKD